MNVVEMCCCGVLELDGIRDHTNPKMTLSDLVGEWFNPAGKFTYRHYDWVTGQYSNREGEREETLRCPAFAVFTDIGKATYGTKLKALIEELSLGTVSQSEPNLNTNSDNNVTVFVWRIDREAFLTHCQEVTAKPKTKKAKVKK